LVLVGVWAARIAIRTLRAIEHEAEIATKIADAAKENAFVAEADPHGRIKYGNSTLSISNQGTISMIRREHSLGRESIFLAASAIFVAISASCSIALNVRMAMRAAQNADQYQCPRWPCFRPKAFSRTLRPIDASGDGCGASCTFTLEMAVRLGHSS